MESMQIHISPVVPTDLKKFNKAQFIGKRAGLILNVKNHQQLDELDGKSFLEYPTCPRQAL